MGSKVFDYNSQTMDNNHNERNLFLLGDTMHEFIKYLDGTTLINFWFSNILQSISKNDAVINYWTLSKFIQQCHFDDNAANDACSNAMNKMDVFASESELYFCGDLMSLKEKVCYHCDIELKFRNITQWNEEWDDTLTLNKYQEFSKIFYGYKREQNTKFVHFEQQIPTKGDNERHSNKQWMECVNIDNLLKYLFDSKAKTELKTLDVYILDYTLMKNMEKPIKFETMENVTICFVKNYNFSDCFVAREWQQYQASK